MPVKETLRNLWNIMGRKITGDLKDVEHVVVFDNSTRDISILYDSDVTTTMSEMFQAIENMKKVTNIRHCYMRSDA
jgi:hypothetical protein